MLEISFHHHRLRMLYAATLSVPLATPFVAKTKSELPFYLRKLENQTSQYNFLYVLKLTF